MDFSGKALLNAAASKAGRKGGRILVGTDSMGGTNLARSTTVAPAVTLKPPGKGPGPAATIRTPATTLPVGAPPHIASSEGRPGGKEVRSWGPPDP